MIKSTPNKIEKVLAPLFLAGFVAADLLIGTPAAIKVMGLAFVVCGVSWVWKKSVGVGVEGRKPVFILRGLAAQAAGALMLALGLAILYESARVACFLGWNGGSLCL